MAINFQHSTASSVQSPVWDLTSNSLNLAIAIGSSPNRVPTNSPRNHRRNAQDAGVFEWEPGLGLNQVASCAAYVGLVDAHEGRTHQDQADRRHDPECQTGNGSPGIGTRRKPNHDWQSEIVDKKEHEHRNDKHLLGSRQIFGLPGGYNLIPICLAWFTGGNAFWNKIHRLIQEKDAATTGQSI